MRWIAIGCVAAATGIASADKAREPDAPPGRVALGFGASTTHQAVRGLLYPLSLGVRITERNWITATYYAGSSDLRTGFGHGHVELFHDVSVAASQLRCMSELCVLSGVAGIGLGYEYVGFEFFDCVPQSVHEDGSDFYGQGRVGLRLGYKHVWLEGAIELRIRVLDRYENVERIGALLGVAAYVVL